MIHHWVWDVLALMLVTLSQKGLSFLSRSESHEGSAVACFRHENG